MEKCGSMLQRRERLTESPICPVSGRRFGQAPGRPSPGPTCILSSARARRVANDSKDNPDPHCLPIGITQLHNHPQPRKIIQTPSVIVILYEANGGIRQIFTDGRPLPNNDPQPWWYGYSIGKWDGDTLVVETTGFRDGGWLDVNGAPLTDAAKMTERFRRVNYGSLEIDVTVDDPKAYTRPWTAVTIRQQLLPDDELIEFVCAENEKSTQRFAK
jgi:hypothetical protein